MVHCGIRAVCSRPRTSTLMIVADESCLKKVKEATCQKNNPAEVFAMVPVEVAARRHETGLTQLWHMGIWSDGPDIVQK